MRMYASCNLDMQHFFRKIIGSKLRFAKHLLKCVNSYGPLANDPITVSAENIFKNSRII